MNDSRILLLVHTHQHAAALHECIPHLKANYQWCWVVYSPAVLADPATVEKEYDQQIADLNKAMRDCYSREDGAGGDSYKSRRDAAVLEKSAKVKEAYKTLSPEQQRAAEDRMFKGFYDAKPCPHVAISRHPDHFETAAHVELQNSLKAGMKPGYLAGDYVVAWPTSLPKGASLAEISKATDVLIQTLKPSTAAPPSGGPAPSVTKATKKEDKRKTRTVDPRLRELMQMSLDDLGPIAFELGIKPTDPIAGKRMALVHRVFEMEKEKTEKEVGAY